MTQIALIASSYCALYITSFSKDLQQHCTTSVWSCFDARIRISSRNLRKYLDVVSTKCYSFVKSQSGQHGRSFNLDILHFCKSRLRQVPQLKDDRRAKSVSILKNGTNCTLHGPAARYVRPLISFSFCALTTRYYRHGP